MPRSIPSLRVLLEREVEMCRTSNEIRHHSDELRLRNFWLRYGSLSTCNTFLLFLIWNWRESLARTFRSRTYAKKKNKSLPSRSLHLKRQYAEHLKLGIVFEFFFYFLFSPHSISRNHVGSTTCFLWASRCLIFFFGVPRNSSGERYRLPARDKDIIRDSEEKKYSN